MSRLPENETILVALSGGADSTALLHRLCEYRKTADCELIAAHVNHGIRGEAYGFEADRDESFCRELCSSLNVKLCVEHLDVPALARESGKSLETEARDQRYSFFSRLMRENGIKILATAHNADDNLETQLFNFARGCGIDGLSGIPESRPLSSVDGGVVIRPLLQSKKSEIIEYCRVNEVGFVTDSTNLEDDCTRNILRHKIIPELENLFPSVHRAGQRLRESATEDADFIISEAKKYLDEENGMIKASRLASLHPSLSKRVLMLSYARVSSATLEAVHLDSLLALLKTQKNGASISLPDKVCASVTDGILRFDREDTKRDGESVKYNLPLSYGLNIISDTPFAVEMSKEASLPCDCSIIGYSLYAHATLAIDQDSIPYVKNRTSGETVREGGINKKIKKLMCDKHVPLLDRDLLPVIRLGSEIVYVPKCAIADSVKPKKNAGGSLVSIIIYKRSSEV